MSDTILNIENITKSFPRVIANKKVTFDIKKNAVHAILGENGAGKSTLVKILYGLLEPDEGNIKLNNKDFKVNSPAEARKQGIGMVFQHFSLFDSLSVKENLILGIDEKMSYSDLENKLENISSRYNLPLDLDAPITALSAGEKQRVEIVRILLQDPQILIMDEPTSVLTPQEVESLFVTLNALVKEGRTILYITHKLEEVISICDTVTIMRSGEIIDTSSTANQTAKTLATKMLGQKLDDLKTNYGHIKDEVNFEVKNISCDFNDPFLTDLKNISFQVRVGEIYGIAGVAGNGQSELMDILTGENINILLSQFPKNNFIRNGIILKNNVDDFANNVINEFKVITPGNDAKASSLSGGNLQKYVIGREISSKPKILIISHPTWGIDAGAEHSIRESLIELSQNGTSIIVISQDLDELIEITHKISVIYDGNLSKPFKTSEIEIEKLGLLMGGKNE